MKQKNARVILLVISERLAEHDSSPKVSLSLVVDRSTSKAKSFAGVLLGARTNQELPLTKEARGFTLSTLSATSRWVDGGQIQNSKRFIPTASLA